MTDHTEAFEADPLSQALGARLKQVRTAKVPRVSRRELALRTGISASTIRAIEAGERSLSLRNLHTLLTALDCVAVLLVSDANTGLVPIRLDSECLPTPTTH